MIVCEEGRVESRDHCFGAENYEDKLATRPDLRYARNVSLHVQIDFEGIILGRALIAVSYSDLAKLSVELFLLSLDSLVEGFSSTDSVHVTVLPEEIAFSDPCNVLRTPAATQSSWVEGLPLQPSTSRRWFGVRAWESAQVSV